jgi:hypothetical protein
LPVRIHVSGGAAAGRWAACCSGRKQPFLQKSSSGRPLAGRAVDGEGHPVPAARVTVACTALVLTLGCGLAGTGRITGPP